VLAALWAEPVREAEEVLLVDRVQHLDDRALDDLVLHRGDPERAHAPVGLGDERSSRSLRPVRSSMQSCVKLEEVVLESLAVLPRDTVDARSRATGQGPVRGVKAIDGDVV